MVLTPGSELARAFKIESAGAALAAKAGEGSFISGAALLVVFLFLQMKWLGKNSRGPHARQ